MRRQRIRTGLVIREEWREVEVDFYPGRPARWYLRNGDPGYPEDPAEYDVISVQGMDVDDLTKDERQDIALAAEDEIRSNK